MAAYGAYFFKNTTTSAYTVEIIEEFFVLGTTRLIFSSFTSFPNSYLELSSIYSNSVVFLVIELVF